VVAATGSVLTIARPLAGVRLLLARVPDLRARQLVTAPGDGTERRVDLVDARARDEGDVH
jgi:hypothetical protein